MKVRHLEVEMRSFKILNFDISLWSVALSKNVDVETGVSLGRNFDIDTGSAV